MHGWQRVLPELRQSIIYLMLTTNTQYLNILIAYLPDFKNVQQFFHLKELYFYKITKIQNGYVNYME